MASRQRKLKPPHCQLNPIPFLFKPTPASHTPRHQPRPILSTKMNWPFPSHAEFGTRPTSNSLPSSPALSAAVVPRMPTTFASLSTAPSAAKSVTSSLCHCAGFTTVKSTIAPTKSHGGSNAVSMPWHRRARFGSKRAERRCPGQHQTARRKFNPIQLLRGGAALRLMSSTVGLTHRPAKNSERVRPPLPDRGLEIEQ